MKYLILSCLILFTLTTCKEEGQLKNIPVNGSAAPAQLPPPNRPETAILTARFWVFDAWVDSLDPAKYRDQKGRWFRFNADGTYDGGHWEDYNDQGTWFLKQGSQYPILITDSKTDDLRDAEWELQGIIDTSNIMSWVKTGKLGDGRVALCKLEPLLTMPSKKQFGVE